MIGVGDSGEKALLNPNALIIIDNTLWKGLVLDKVNYIMIN
jgi:predicted O-methyltransferase YrrM